MNGIFLSSITLSPNVVGFFFQKIKKLILLSVFSPGNFGINNDNVFFKNQYKSVRKVRPIYLLFQYVQTYRDKNFITVLWPWQQSLQQIVKTWHLQREAAILPEISIFLVCLTISTYLISIFSISQKYTTVPMLKYVDSSLFNLFFLKKRHWHFSAQFRPYSYFLENF